MKYVRCNKSVHKLSYVPFIYKEITGDGILKTKLAIIADDLTGSNDTGLQFRKKGAKTGVVINLSEIDNALKELDVVVVDTESRFDTKDTAFEKVYKTSRTLTEKGILHIYKKIDSTMRGNIGAEIDGAIEGARAKAALVVPAFPSLGRITQDGICYLNGIPVEYTEIAKDPKTPISSSHIPTIINWQSKRKVVLIGLEDIHQGSVEISIKIKTLLEGGSEIIVLDAVTNDDLALIAQAVRNLDETIVLAGSAGLAEHIAVHLTIVDSEKQEFKPIIQEFKPIIIVAGSVSEVTNSQISRALEENYVQAIDVDIQALFTEREKDEKQRIIQETGRISSLKSDIVIRSAGSREDIETAQRLGDQKGLDLSGTGEHITRFLGDVTMEICSTTKLRGLILTGGDTAIKVADVMDISGTVIIDEVLPGIPLSYFISDTFGDIPIVTKAGAFGKEDAIVKIIDFLRKS